MYTYYVSSLDVYYLLLLGPPSSRHWMNVCTTCHVNVSLHRWTHIDLVCVLMPAAAEFPSSTLLPLYVSAAPRFKSWFQQWPRQGLSKTKSRNQSNKSRRFVHACGWLWVFASILPSFRLWTGSAWFRYASRASLVCHPYQPEVFRVGRANSFEVSGHTR